MTPVTSQQIRDLLASFEAGARVYLVGAGGCGMSGLGHLLLDLGHRVGGSDLSVGAEVRELRGRGAEIAAGHEAEHLVRFNPHLVVYSSAIRRDNPQLAVARQAGIPLVRRAVLLAALVQTQSGICVAGMHGKTTTTALLAHALRRLGAPVSYAVGARVPQVQPHAFYARPVEKKVTPCFVFEADESDGSLLEFHPHTAILLNVDEEHLDYYANFEAVCAAFARFIGQTSRVVYFCADDARLSELTAANPRAISYGFNPLATYRAVALAGSGSEQSARRSSRFEVWRSGQRLGVFGISLFGIKNISNATAVIACLHGMGYEPGQIAAAISDFTGAARRQEELFSDGRFRVFDDYGHHPAEIAATIQAFRGLHPRRLLVAFQPHRYTRTQLLLREFATCFQGVDRLWLGEVYAASEPEIAGVNSARLAAAIREAGQQVELIPSLANLTQAVRAAMMPGDVVLFLGAGDITKAAHALAAELRREPGEIAETMFTELTQQLSSGSVVRQNEPLGRRTTMRVGGPAEIYVEPATEEDLGRVLRFCRERSLPFTFLGRGSNLLIRDGGIRGVVICLSQPAFSGLEFRGAAITCGAGVKLKTLAVEARRQGVSGLEFLEGIPGTLGGALRMNAGAMGSWLFDVVETVRFMDFAGQVQERKAAEVNVEYRGCPLFKDHVALAAILRGQPAAPAAIGERMERFSQRRWASQPAAPSAGCIFKNPATIPAGKLIDELGLKGTRIGGAMVSDVHANFIINDGTATAQDVLNLISRIQETARAQRGIELETEVQVIGED